MSKERLLTPQQELFLSYYTNPKSETFSNAYQSAKKAGYSEEYSQNMTGQMPDWLSENMSDIQLVKKAEKVLDKTLNFEPVSEDGKVDTALLKTQTDVAKFVAERLNKNKYSLKQEITGGVDLKLAFDPIFNQKTNGEPTDK